MELSRLAEASLEEWQQAASELEQAGREDLGRSLCFCFFGWTTPPQKRREEEQRSLFCVITHYLYSVGTHVGTHVGVSFFVGWRPPKWLVFLLVSLFNPPKNGVAPPQNGGFFLRVCFSIKKRQGNSQSNSHIRASSNRGPAQHM